MSIPSVLRVGLGLLMLAHGIAHLPGFAGAWRLATFPDLPYHTTLLAGRLDVGDGGMRVVGALWLLLGAAFALAGVGALAGRAGWPALAVGAALASLALCVGEWPAARVGAWVDAALLVVLLAVPRLVGPALGGPAGALPTR